MKLLSFVYQDQAQFGVIQTGTPGGVGARRVPPLFMQPNDVVEVQIEKIGSLKNQIQ